MASNFYHAGQLNVHVYKMHYGQNWGYIASWYTTKIAASCQLYICTYYNFTNYFKDKLLTKLDFSPFCVHLQIPVLPRMVELHYIVLNRM